MDITEIRVKLMENRTDKLQAFCSITISNEFVIRDLKIIEGTTGPFVAMPSRKLTERCPRCGNKNHLRAKFCNDCGAKQSTRRAGKDNNGKEKFHADVAHPINSTCREVIQQQVLVAFQAEVNKSKEEGYVAPDYDDFADATADGTPLAPSSETPAPAPTQAQSKPADEEKPARRSSRRPRRERTPARREKPSSSTFDSDFEVIHSGDSPEDEAQLETVNEEPIASEPVRPKVEPAKPKAEPIAEPDPWGGSAFDDEPVVAQPVATQQVAETQAVAPIPPAPKEPEPKKEETPQETPDDGFSTGIF